MKILAIDPATKLGYAYTKDSGKPAHGTEEFHNSQWDGAGVRFLKFKAWLETFNELDLVAYEAVEFTSFGQAISMYNRWIGVLQTHCEENNIPYTGYPVGTIKKFWTGKGSASKKDMIAAARERGFNPKDDNAADALAIYHLALDSFGKS
jgi:crossover junction endodeoxyribonuclease RuvC